MQQVHETDGITYNKRLTDMEAEFARTKEQLASENMVPISYFELTLSVLLFGIDMVVVNDGDCFRY